MKKLALMLLLVFISLPVYVFAGEGFNTLYNPWFDDRSDMTGTPFKYRNYVNLANPNDDTAVLKITYYHADGTKFANTSSFTHSIPPKGKLGFRPNLLDLKLNSASDDVRGSYVIEVTNGAIIGQNTISVIAGDTLPNLGHDYNVDDPIYTSIRHLDTFTSNHWEMQGFMQGDFNGDTVPLVVNDYDTFFYINNPDDKFSAQVNLYFHNTDGTPINTTPYIETIAPHQTSAISPTKYGITGDNSNWPASITFGLVTIDAVNRKVIGFTSKERCLSTIHGNEYQLMPEPFFATHK